jgi:hypothetical protein
MRSANMQVLTDQIKEKRPGVVVYGIGDEAHKLEVSGHNEDDTAGVRAEDQDEDTTPEHRAVDVMIGSAFVAEDASALFYDLGRTPENQARLLYVIHAGKILSRSRNWEIHDFSGDPHDDHVHVSGEADDDSNTMSWVLSDWGNSPAPAPLPTNGLLTVDGKLGPKTIAKWQSVMGTPVDGIISTPYSKLVAAVQQRLHDTVDSYLKIDGNGIFQNDRRYKTVGDLQRYLKSPVDQIISFPVSQVVKALQRRLNENRF